MSFKFHPLLLLLSLTLITNTFFAQFKTTITISIDTNCSCNNLKKKDLNGKFGLYAYNVAVPKYSNNYIDTLVQVLDLKNEQNITLDQGSYKLIYTPNDSLKKSNEHYITNPKINLTCFFFNKSHSSLIRQMGKKDILVFSSTYFGITNDDTIIPTHITAIYKKGKKFYVSYIKNEHKSFQISYIDVLPTGSFKSKFVLPESKYLLTEEQLELIIKFEKNLWKMATDNNLGNGLTAKSSIKLNNKEIRFYSKGYISLALWNEITQSHKNP